MLKKLRLFLLISFATFWFILVIPYILIQTEFGASYASNIISQHNDQYFISVGRVSHSITKPYEITLENVTVQNHAKTISYLTAQKIVIGLKKNDLLQMQSFDYLLFENSHIKLLQDIPMVETAFLQLKNTDISYNDTANDITFDLENINGGIAPWSNQIITQRLDTQFNFSIEKATYRHINIQAIVVQGLQKNSILQLTNLGGNINHGFFTANGAVLANNDININQLKLNNIHTQTAMNLSNIDAYFVGLPKTTIQFLSIINSSISIPNLMIEKGNIEAKNIIYDKHWLFENSDLTFNAESIVWYDELIEQPLLQWNYEQDHIAITQALAKWNKGIIKFSGYWQDQNLTVDSMIAGGFRYQLPENWYPSLYTLKYPDLLPQSIFIKQFILMPSLLIDTNPEFPFQFSAFEAFGNNVEMNMVDDEVSLSGTILVKADNATLNSVELKKPDLTLELTPSHYLLSFSTLNEQGLLEGKATLKSTQEIASLQLEALGINSEILSKWSLIKNPEITDKFNVQLQGFILPLRLNGQLIADGKIFLIENNQQLNH